jgi:acetyltransferase-like isoleucine patch superfamily enzyme
MNLFKNNDNFHSKKRNLVLICRKAIFEKIFTPKEFRYRKKMQIVHPSAVISNNVTIGANVIIGPNCTIGFPGFQINQIKSLDRKTVIGDNTIIMGNSVVCIGTKIGINCRIDYHSFIGEMTQIESYCVIEYGARIYDNVIIGDHSTISGFICNYSKIGKSSIVQGDLIHKFKEAEIDQIENPPQIGDNCFIGRNALIIGDIVISDGTYIAAGSIVTKSTKQNTFYCGSPAQEVGIAPKPYINGVGNFNEDRFIKKYEEIINCYSWI